MTTTLGVLFDGLAYGMLLFLISVGLSVTMGLMRFINLAHGVFAMAGGYLVATLARQYAVHFFVALPLAFVFGAALSLVLERTLYRHLYKRGPLDQVLLTVGILFVATAVAIYIFGSQQQPVVLPDGLQGRVDVLGVELSRYRLFLIAAGIVITVVLVFGLERTRFGARIRASVDKQSVAEAMGIRVERVFQATFAIGGGLAALGGALGIDVLGLDPNFAQRYLVYFLLVVVVGGPGSIVGTLIAALLLGVADVSGKYYVPQIGSFVIYVAMILLLFLFPHGLFSKRSAK
jgi:branched-chain amino acid transport system permease protein